MSKGIKRIVNEELGSVCVVNEDGLLIEYTSRDRDKLYILPKEVKYITDSAKICAHGGLWIPDTVEYIFRKDTKYGFGFAYIYLDNPRAEVLRSFDAWEEVYYTRKAMKGLLDLFLNMSYLEAESYFTYSLPESFLDYDMICYEDFEGWAEAHCPYDIDDMDEMSEAQYERYEEKRERYVEKHIGYKVLKDAEVPEGTLKDSIKFSVIPLSKYFAKQFKVDEDDVLKSEVALKGYLNALSGIYKNSLQLTSEEIDAAVEYCLKSDVSYKEQLDKLINSRFSDTFLGFNVPMKWWAKLDAMYARHYVRKVLDVTTPQDLLGFRLWQSLRVGVLIKYWLNKYRVEEASMTGYNKLLKQIDKISLELQLRDLE